MDSLKKPETIIGLVNTAALLGASIYFYRKINNLELELNKHSEHLTSTVNKVKDIANTKKYLAQLANAIKELNNMIGEDRKTIDTLKQIVLLQANQITELQNTVEQLRDEFEESNLEIKLNKENPYIRNLYPPQPPRQQYQQPQYQPQAPTPPQQYRPAPQQYPQQSQYQPQPHPPQQYQQHQYQQPHPPQQQYQQPQQYQHYQSGELTNYGQTEEIIDEDAAINAVRRAKQSQSQEGDLLNLFD